MGGWYGQKKGLRGRFGMYLPPLLEALGLAEFEHNARNNRMRALNRLATRARETRARGLGRIFTSAVVTQRLMPDKSPHFAWNACCNGAPPRRDP